MDRLCGNRNGRGCGLVKPLSEFRGNRNTCKPCDYAQYIEWTATPEGQEARARYRARKAAGLVATRSAELSKAKRQATRKRVWDIKVAAGCTDCGITDGRVLDLDHVKGEKLMAVATMIDRNFAWEKIEAEIAKCEVRCRNCHHIVTAERAGWRATWDFA